MNLTIFLKVFENIKPLVPSPGNFWSVIWNYNLKNIENS